MKMNNLSVEVGPQKGKQQLFIDQFYKGVDVCFYGGAAGGGKTFALLFEALRQHRVKNFKSIIFRKNITHINIPGGLWDAASEMYTMFNARCVKNERSFFLINTTVQSN